MPHVRKRVAVLISGRGSNLAALLSACGQPDFPAGIVLVVSNRPGAGGLAHAAAAGVPTAVVDHKAFGSKPAFEAALEAELRRAAIELVCLAGFMRLLSPGFVDAWRDRLINIHPSLLPAFPGLGTHERALAAGVRIHGATVHYVRAETDSGPIIAQAAIAVRADDTPETLSDRVLTVEHRLYPHALRLVASGAVAVRGGRVVFVAPARVADDALIAPAT